MSMLRGFVFRGNDPVYDGMLHFERPWCVDIGTGSWNEVDDWDIITSLSPFATHQEALDAACAWLAENDATTKAYEAGAVRS